MMSFIRLKVLNFNAVYPTLPHVVERGRMIFWRQTSALKCAAMRHNQQKKNISRKMKVNILLNNKPC